MRADPIISEAGGAPSTLALQRASGRLALAARAEGPVTRLADLHQSSPCRALFPRVGPGEALRAVLVNTSGGLVEGDRMAIEIAAGARARLAVTTQAAEKVYRSLTATSRVETELRIAPGAFIEWRPQETILFDRSRLARRLSASLAGDARLLAAECVLFGRAARGETFAQGFLHDAWSLRRDGRLVWFDVVRLDGDILAQRRKPFAFGEAAGYATIVYAGPDAASFLPVARQAAEQGPWTAGATLVNGLLVARALATNEAHLRRAAEIIADALRAALVEDVGRA